MASRTNVSLTNETVTATTANGSTLLVAQYLVGPMFITKIARGTVSAAPRTASHIKLKNQTTYLLPLNTARTRKKKRRDVAGRHMTYVQEITCWSSLQLPIGAANIMGVSWECAHVFWTKSSNLLLTFNYSDGQNKPQHSKPVGGINKFLSINLDLLTLIQSMQQSAGRLGT